MLHSKIRFKNRKVKYLVYLSYKEKELVVDIMTENEIG